MKIKCPVCNSCLDYAYVANRRFFNCFLCQVTYDIRDNKLIVVTDITLEKDMNGNDKVKEVKYGDN